jgi:hypothetical protein
MAAASLDPLLRPWLRGVLHQWAFVVSSVAGVSLVLEAGSTRARIAMAIYAPSVAARSAPARTASTGAGSVLDAGCSA